MIDTSEDTTPCGFSGNWCYIHHCYPATCEKMGLGIHAKPEGATTQPTQNGISKIFGTWPGDETEEELLAALSEIRNPSAGSKPQEEGGTLEDALIEAIAALRSSYNVQDFPADGDTRQDHAANALEAILHRRLTPSQPVADGGGLPRIHVTKEDLNNTAKQLAELDGRGYSGLRDNMTRMSICDLLDNFNCRERQLASAQEALIVARERAALLERLLREHMAAYICDTNDLHNRSKVSLLSPEGSSRS